MAKIVLFCADGTWNGPGRDEDHDGVPDPTNVFKVFANLDGQDTPETTRLADEQEKTLAEGGAVVQWAKYLHGVGDSRNCLVRLVGGAAGRGLITRIVRGYTFVSRVYESGDRIFLLGFSRGAYTARALAGLIDARGLLDASRIDLADKEQAYRLGSGVWFDWRKEVLQNRPTPFARLHELAEDLPGFFSKPPTAARVPNVPIEVVAVWDTVGSYGIPTYATDGTRDDPFQFADRKLSGVARRGLHAVALDEQRADFTPTLWDDDERVTQVLFPGAHSDVGGGYSMAGQCGLSDRALYWMMDQLFEAGVRFSPAAPYIPKPDFHGIAHEPWNHPPFVALAHVVRKFTGRLLVDESVRQRMGCGPVVCDPGLAAVAYAPTNLP